MKRISSELAKQYGIKLPDDSSEKSLSPNDIAKVLNVTGEAVKHWIYKGYLPAIKQANGYWRVTVSDFERFLKAKRSPRSTVFVEGASEIAQAVSTWGYDVMRASNVADAVLKITASPPVFIVVDLNSKRLSGLELLKRKRRMRLIGWIPSLVVGALSDEEIMLAAELGVQAIARDATEAITELERILRTEDRRK